MNLADSLSWRAVGEHAFGDEDAWRLGEAGPWLDLMYWPTAGVVLHQPHPAMFSDFEDRFAGAEHRFRTSPAGCRR